MVEKDFFFLNAVKSGMPYRGVRYRTMHVLCFAFFFVDV